MGYTELHEIPDQPISPACQDTCEWQHIHLVQQLSVLYPRSNENSGRTAQLRAVPSIPRPTNPASSGSLPEKLLQHCSHSLSCLAPSR